MATGHEQRSSAESSGQTAGISRNKRILLKAGWVAPVIMAVGLPRSGFAANASGNNGDNGNHGDGNNGNHGDGNNGNGNGNTGNGSGG